MASVHLSRCYVHNAADPSQYVELITTTNNGTPIVVGQVRTYAGGRRRLVRSSGQSENVAYSFQPTDPDVTWQLEQWVGSLVMVRDEVGRKRWGTYLQLAKPAVQGNEDKETAVGFTLEQTTHSEVV
jgi:hypothetical protein